MPRYASSPLRGNTPAPGPSAAERVPPTPPTPTQVGQTEQAKPRKQRRIRAAVCRRCGCNEAQTTLWRSNPEPAPAGVDNVLCNACGIYLAEHRVPRPARFFKRPMPSASGSGSPPSSRSSSPPNGSHAYPTKRRRCGGSTSSSSKQAKRELKTGSEDEQQEAAAAAEALIGLRKAESPVKAMATSPISPTHLSLRPSWIYNQPPRPAQPVLPAQLVPHRSADFLMASPDFRSSTSPPPYLTGAHMCCPGHGRSARASVLRIEDLLASPQGASIPLRPW